MSEGNSLPRGKHSGALSCSLRRLPSSRRSGAAREAAQARVADAERAAEGLTRLPGEAGLTRTLAIELGPRQIMVNAIAPGMVRTPMLAGMTAGRISHLAAGYPGGRLPEAEDIAQAIGFSGDPQTMFITGQVLIIDGGRSVGLSGTEPHGDRPHHAAAVRASRLRAPP